MLFGIHIATFVKKNKPMTKTLKISFFCCLSFMLTKTTLAQRPEPSAELKNWYNQHELGIQTQKAYKKLKRKKSKTIIVAVIDSGVDIEHEDLQGQIWVNKNEIPGNGKDDDKNGYIDDVHGWNFLGNASGENINETRLEKARIFKRLRDKYEEVDPKLLQDDSEYKLYQKVKDEIAADKKQFEQYMPMLDKLPEEYQVYIKTQMEFNLNPDFDDRSLIGDDPENIEDAFYGNGDVEGPDALHGTHVAGIIGAIRGNEFGGDGVAENVKIMSVRAVPNGDEHDKDVALAIRYAVDNGAKIINMSFGKGYSPNQKWVHDAIKYADERDVLLVHAAGNDAQNVDETPNFPTSMYSFQKAPFKSFLTIGASTPEKEKLNASFSNYGKTKVDVFAPGEKIYNTVPDNKYKWLQGTSMAAPVVSGAAAFLASYFPKLSMEDIKNILMETATKHDGSFADLSVTGGVINLKCAIKKAKKLSRKK